jgi:Fe2+ transport system protein FeoA
MEKSNTVNLLKSDIPLSLQVTKKMRFEDDPNYFNGVLMDNLSCQSEPINITDLSKQMNCERRVLGKYLYRLVSMGLIIENIVGRTKYYSCFQPEFKTSLDLVDTVSSKKHILFYHSFKNKGFKPIYFDGDSEYSISAQRVMVIEDILKSYREDYGLSDDGIVKEITNISDIETTGFYRDVNKWGDLLIDKIVQCGLTFVDDYLGEILDSFYFNVREHNFNESFRNSYIFNELRMDFDSINNLNPNYYSLESYRDFINLFLKLIKITSYNKWFDLYFLEAKRFRMRFEAPCVMQAGISFLRKEYKNGLRTDKERLNFRLKEVYEFITQKELEMSHHGGWDSYHTAEIVQKLVEMGIWKEKSIEYIKRIF